MAVKKIGILTGGGDCPGLNPTIKGIVTRAADHGIECLGLQNGWASLTKDQPNARPLSVDDVRPIIKMGGTMLHTSRTNAYNPKTPGVLDESGQVISTQLELDAIVAIGGDDTLVRRLKRLTKGDNLRTSRAVCRRARKRWTTMCHGTDRNASVSTLPA